MFKECLVNIEVVISGSVKFVIFFFYVTSLMKNILNIFFDVSFLLLERIISHLGHIIYQNFFFTFLRLNFVVMS